MTPEETLGWAEKVRRVAEEVDPDTVRRAQKTHYWRNGTTGVICKMCGVSKASLEGTQPCPVVVFGDPGRYSKPFLFPER